MGIGVDGAGNVYTTGAFVSYEADISDFHPGPGTFELTTVQEDDIFVSKLNSDGEFQWAVSIGGFNVDVASDIAVDEAGNTYTTGLYHGTVDFHPGLGTQNLTSAAGGDAFVLKLDTDGNLVWSRSFGRAEGFGIAVDPLGNVYTTGASGGAVDFDPGPGVFELSNAGTFVSKLNSAGNFVWAQSLEGSGGNEIAVDSLGNSYTIGDSDAGIAVSALSSSGNLRWSKTFSSGKEWSGRGYDVAVDSQQNVYVTGIFVDPVDFDPGVGTATLTSIGAEDIFICRLGAAGNFVWAGSMGGQASNDVGFAIAIDPSDNVYTTGWFTGPADLDPNKGMANMPGDGLSDVFVTKFTAEVVAPLPVGKSSGGGNCFIATAAYGTPLAEEVDVLRGVRDGYLFNGALGTLFVDAYYRLSPPVADVVWGSEALRGVRDGYLLNGVLGAVFVDAYYRVSPPVAEVVRGSEGLRRGVRDLLAPVVLFSRILLVAPGLMVLVGVFSLFVFLLREKAIRPEPSRVKTWKVVLRPPRNDGSGVIQLGLR